MAWNLLEKRRIKIIKRLFLQWHPEKNIGDAELYNEVIQHLQNEIGKLDSGETTCNQVSSYKPFYNVWTKRAKLLHTRRQNTGQHLTKNMDLRKPQRLTVLSREFLQVSARRNLNQVRRDVGLDKRKPT